MHQRLEDLPAGFSVPEGRIKPWGTRHAVRACREVVDGPFAIINADDFYGPGAFSAVYGFLTSPHPETEHAMVAYRLRNTVTEHGSVARGVCQVRDGYLTGITERTSIVCRHGETAWQDEDGRYHPLAGDTPVSMNLWGFSQSMMDALDRRFADFLTREMPGNPMKAEYFLPGRGKRPNGPPARRGSGCCPARKPGTASPTGRTCPGYRRPWPGCGSGASILPASGTDRPAACRPFPPLNPKGPGMAERSFRGPGALA